MPFEAIKITWPRLSFSRDGGTKIPGKEFLMLNNPLQIKGEMFLQDKESASDEITKKLYDFLYF